MLLLELAFPCPQGSPRAAGDAAVALSEEDSARAIFSWMLSKAQVPSLPQLQLHKVMGKTRAVCKTNWAGSSGLCCTGWDNLNLKKPSSKSVPEWKCCQCSE